MENQKFCQSCAMPLTKPEEFGTEAGGVPSEDYCVHCRKDGKFTMVCTMEQMIDFCVPYCVEMGVYPDEAAARADMMETFPRMKRWTMRNAVWFITYKLVEGACAEEFQLAAKKTHDEVLSKRKGFISWKMLAQGDVWADLVTWETMEDLAAAEKDDGAPGPVEQAFCAFIDPDSIKMQAYSVAKDF